MKSESPSNRNPATLETPPRMRAVVSRMRRAAFSYPPSPPTETMAAKETADNALGRLPAKVGEKYSPPGHSAVAKY